VLMSKKLVGGDPFALLLADELMVSNNPPLDPLLRGFSANKAAGVVGVIEVPKEDVCHYGIVAGELVSSGVLKMSEMIEKPEVEKAPSCYATPGRYIFDSKIFKYLEAIPKGRGGEYQLTDAINLMAQKESVFSIKMEIERFDTGQLPGYLKAVVALALERDDLKDDFREFILKRVQA